MSYKKRIEEIAIETIMYYNENFSPKIKIILYVPNNYNVDNYNNDKIYILNHKITNTTLFKKCDIIVHHGGIGTCFASILSKKISIIIPHAIDQFFNASLLDFHELAINLKNLNKLDSFILSNTINNIIKMDKNIDDKFNIIEEESNTSEEKIIEFFNNVKI